MMRFAGKALLCAAAASAFSCAMLAQMPSAERVGVYHWGGARTVSMAEGVSRIASLGAHAARVAMTPRYRTDYNVGEGCYPQYSLSRLLKEPDVQKALSDPRIKVFMLTAYDGATNGDCSAKWYLNPFFFTKKRTAAIEKEYSEFTLALAKAHNGSGKLFIVSNWEGDNDVYCGSAYRYVGDDAFRGWCDAAYPGMYNGNASPAASLEGLAKWFAARQRGIEDGMRRARREGIRGVSVVQAPEFSSVRALREKGLPSVLYNVIPRVPSEYVSYSSYESICRAGMEAEFLRDMAEVRRVAGGRGIIVGEFGYSRSAWSDVVSRTDVVIKTALQNGAAFLFQWNLYDQTPSDNLGLFDLNGDITDAGRYYREMLQRD